MRKTGLGLVAASAALVMVGLLAPSSASATMNPAIGDMIQLANSQGNHGGGANCSNPARCAVGTSGPGGGVIFYASDSNSGFPCGPQLTATCHYLEAATTVLDRQMHWKQLYKWSNASMLTTLIGSTAEATAIGTGYANTLAIINQSGPFDSTTNAYEAGYAHSYNGGGKTDWYLPSKDELSAFYAYAYALNDTKASWWNTSTVLDSSTEVNATQIWMQEMGKNFGYTDGNNQIVTESKDGNNFTLPIRAF